jgi:hypothetical protein
MPLDYVLIRTRSTHRMLPKDERPPCLSRAACPRPRLNSPRPPDSKPDRNRPGLGSSPRRRGLARLPEADPSRAKRNIAGKSRYAAPRIFAAALFRPSAQIDRWPPIYALSQAHDYNADNTCFPNQSPPASHSANCSVRDQYCLFFRGGCKYAERFRILLRATL